MILCATAVAFATVAHAAVFNVQAPTSAKSNGAITITWESDTSDDLPVIIALFTQNGPFAIANNVDPEANKATIVLPRVVPGPGYKIGLISMSNTSEVLASSFPFAIAPAATISSVNSADSASSSGTAASSTAHLAIPSIASANLPILSGTSSVHTNPPNVSAIARSGDALSAHLPVSGLALVLGGLVVGAWVI
ncbi:hypothetical protein B0H13DRAFT_2328930 [Mycena leptocephala]|nr:hypothetical protein B0H13DRAFT_2328930 [Mycena leptocephala]